MPNSIWQRYIQSPIKDLRCSFWRRQLTVPEVYSQRSRTSKMKLFERNFFSRPLLTAIHYVHKKFHLRCSTLFCQYTTGTINYFCNRLHLDVWLGSRYTSDMFKESQKLQKTSKGVIFRNTAAKTRNNF